MKSHVSVLAATLALGAATVVAETVKDREGAVRQDRLTMERDGRWIYNNWRRGLEEAKWKGKPVLVVLRCVPCLACAGIDASVLSESQLAPWLDQFVCVRVINANDLDLSLFQFDYDLSFSALLLNGDGTIYGRYGSWTHQKNAADKTVAGFKRALEAALTLHRGYPSNHAALAGKQGAPAPFKDPLAIPALAGKYKRELDWEGKVVPSCVHCHQIGDALRTFHRAEGKAMPPELVYPMPLPDTVGLKLAVDQIAQVESIVAESPAARAGLRVGDELISVAGQPLVSNTDVSWALHRAPSAGSLALVIKRAGTQQTVNLLLPENWRRNSDIARRVGTWQMRAMALGGLQLQDLRDEERAERNLKPGTLALFVKHAGEYGEHAAAKKAGFQKNDVIVELDAVSTRMTESELIGDLLARHRPGAKIKATVLRGSERLDLWLPMQ